MNEPSNQGIARPSVASLLLAPHSGREALSSATGFVVESEDGRRWLITCWHVVSGRDPLTGRPLSPSGKVPDRLRILHNLDGSLGRWTWRIEFLLDRNGEPRWLEHPEYGRAFDVVALELTDTATVEFFPYDVDTIGLPGGSEIIAGRITQPLSIVGFPFGLAGGGAFAIWSQGTVATEALIDYQGKPCFLIDSRTRPGQSGSPVIFYADGGTVPTTDGGSVALSGPVELLLGVYSGRINDQSDLGFVWRRVGIKEIVESGVPGSVD
jgi:hypothetical protein